MTSESKPHSRILICEDDRATAQALCGILEGSGYVCDLAESAAEARALIAKRHYAAMTLDLMLPDVDGTAFLGELRGREETRQLPVVVVSVQAGTAPEVAESAAVGVLDWLSKPVSEKRLLAAVRQAARRRGDGPPRILHVEDDPAMRQAVAAMLGTAAEVSEAANLAEARQLLAHGRFDLVLLDLILPDGYGLELTRELNAKDPPIPVVVFSIMEPRRRRDQDRLAATLVKSRSGTRELLEVIAAQIAAAETAG